MTRQEAAEFWDSVDRLPGLSPERQREREAAWREDGSFLVVAFGMLSDRVLTAHGTREEAEAVLERIQAKAREGGLPCLPLTQDLSPYDVDVRTQDDRDGLLRAIHEGYERSS